ncbi:hypothetical protein D3C73_1173160 [compost metagenome]
MLAVHLALIQEGRYKILFIEIGLLGDQFIHRRKISFTRPVYIGRENSGRHGSGSDCRLELLLGFGIIGLHDAFDDDLLLRGVELLNERLHIFPELAAESVPELNRYRLAWSDSNRCGRGGRCSAGFRNAV